MKKVILFCLLCFTAPVAALGVSPAVLELNTITKGEKVESCFWLSNQEKEKVFLEWGGATEWIQVVSSQNEYDFQKASQICFPVSVDTSGLKPGEYSHRLTLKEAPEGKNEFSIYPALSLELSFDIIEGIQKQVQVLSFDENRLDVMNTGSVHLKNLTLFLKNDKGELAEEFLGNLPLRETKAFHLEESPSLLSAQLFDGENLLFEKSFEKKLPGSAISEQKPWEFYVFSLIMTILTLLVLHFLWFRL